MTSSTMSLQGNNAFDSAAEGYDREFTDSPCGRLQRQRVHRYLAAHPLPGAPLRILELNCGTGEDALWFAERGHRVLATDASEAMLKVARNKAVAAHPESDGRLRFRQCRFEDIGKYRAEAPFDLIFSDFGGLNCAGPDTIRELAGVLGELLAPQGRLIAVVMGRRCLWERIYFCCRGRFGAAFRRLSRRPLPVRVADGAEQLTWYYAPDEFARLLAPAFQQQASYPVGIAIPPSYLDPFFSKRPSWLRRLVRWEERLSGKHWSAGWSDHFLIECSLSVSPHLQSKNA